MHGSTNAGKAKQLQSAVQTKRSSTTLHPLLYESGYAHAILACQQLIVELAQLRICAYRKCVFSIRRIPRSSVARWSLRTIRRRPSKEKQTQRISL